MFPSTVQHCGKVNMKKILLRFLADVKAVLITACFGDSFEFLKKKKKKNRNSSPSLQMIDN